jgi:uncharacterized protein (TIGR02118 family)
LRAPECRIEKEESPVIKRIALVRRKPDMTAEEFWTHYTGPHAAIVRKMVGLRRMVLSRLAGPQATQWDAVGELWFDSVAAVERAFADPEIASLLQADRPLFLGGSEVVVAEEEVFWPSTDA